MYMKSSFLRCISHFECVVQCNFVLRTKSTTFCVALLVRHIDKFVNRQFRDVFIVRGFFFLADILFVVFILKFIVVGVCHVL